MSARPIYLPQDLVPPAVLAAEAVIALTEGRFHVNGTYYRDEAIAAQNRRWAAEKLVREALRAAARLPECVFCHDPIEQGQDRVTLAGEDLHRDCARCWDDFANSPTPKETLEQLDGIDAPIAAAA